MAERLIKLGDYTFPETFHVSSVPAESRVATVEVPRRDGVAIGEPHLKEKTINIRGMLRGDTPDALRVAMDSLLAAVNSGEQKLYLWDDRYIMAVKTECTMDYDDTSFGRYCFVSIGFLCRDPFWLSETESLDTWTSPITGGSRDISVGGNAPAPPVFAITAASAGELKIELGLGDQYFTLTGEVGEGDVIEVDCTLETVEIDPYGSEYEYEGMGMFDASFFTFEGGAVNTLTYTKLGEVDAAQIVTRWQNRWY